MKELERGGETFERSLLFIATMGKTVPLKLNICNSKDQTCVVSLQKQVFELVYVLWNREYPAVLSSGDCEMCQDNELVVL